MKNGRTVRVGFFTAFCDQVSNDKKKVMRPSHAESDIWKVKVDFVFPYEILGIQLEDQRNSHPNETKYSYDKKKSVINKSVTFEVIFCLLFPCKESGAPKPIVKLLPTHGIRLIFTAHVCQIWIFN